MSKHYRENMTGTKLVLILAAVAACGKDCPPPPQVEVLKPCEEPKEPFCPRTACGANSPTVNTFPTNGVRSDGECNNDGVQLMPAMVTGGPNGKCNGTTLTMRNNQLVTINPKDNSESCTGEDLKNASFVLRSWTKKDGKYNTLTVKIADVVPAYAADGIQHPRMAYRMTDDKGVSLCTAKGSTEARDKQLGLGPLTNLTDPTPGRDLVIPVRSELYDRDGHAVPLSTKWKSIDLEWLNFACVDDALAKRSLYNLHSDDAATGRAALMMFIANYCGDFHATARGREIRWEIASDATSAPRGTSILEAKWGPHGALCMSAPRELYQDGATPTVPHDPQADLLKMKELCPGCTTPEAWANEMRRCQTMKYKQEQQQQQQQQILPCEKCDTAECKGVVLRSYVAPKAASIP